MVQVIFLEGLWQKKWSGHISSSEDTLENV